MKHIFLDDQLQRSLVRHNGDDYVRIARWVKSTGELMDIGQGVTPTWRRLVGPDGDKYFIPEELKMELERCFITTLIHQNVDSGAIKPRTPMYRLLKVGETIQEGDEYQSEDYWTLTAAAGCSVERGEVYRRAVLSRSPEAAE